MLKAIERGFVQQEIQNAAYEYQQSVDKQEAIVVGVNRFEVEEEKPIPIQRIDPALERKAGGARSRAAGQARCRTVEGGAERQSKTPRDRARM